MNNELRKLNPKLHYRRGFGLKVKLVLIGTMQRVKVPMGQPPSVLGGGRGKRKERVGWAGHTGREESLVRLGKHSEPFIQHKAGEEFWLCVATEWPHAAAQTHPCGCERAFSTQPQTCWTHLAQSQCQLSR